MRKFLAGMILTIFMAVPAFAGPSADLLVKHTEAGTLSDGIAAITGDDAEAHAARGMLKFLLAIEHAGQSLHRHGLAVGGVARMGLPILRLPVPPNPKPEPLDYAKFRAIFATVVDDLAAAEADLAKVGEGQVKLPVDVLSVRLDLDGDGKASDYESLAAMMSDLLRREDLPGSTIAFDTADVYWLRGYGNFLGAFSQFLLAHDFQAMFDKTFHIYFPSAGLPYAEKLQRGATQDMFANDDVGDAIAMIHLINWKVIEPERRKDVRLKLKAMADLSALSWKSARSETDSDREWLPNSKQTPALPLAPVDDSVIDGWLAVMGEFGAVLEGQKLLPHWRFAEGINLKRMLDEGTDFDLVLLVAGADAVPWLEAGAVSDTASWDSLMAVFQGNFLGYAMWFN
jgi:hypothetical protein